MLQDKLESRGLHKGVWQFSHRDQKLSMQDSMATPNDEGRGWVPRGTGNTCWYRFGKRTKALGPGGLGWVWDGV